MNWSLIIRRIGIALVVALVLTCGVGLISEDAAVLFFLPSWIALFIGWPYLSRKLGFDFPKAPAPRQSRPLAWSRVLFATVLALVTSYGLAVFFHPDLFWPSLLCLCLAFYGGLPFLSRRLPFLNFSKAATSLSAGSPATTHPLWRRMVRGTLAMVGGVVLAIFLMAMTVVIPIDLCHRRAQKVHDSVHIGMTVPQVLRTARDCDAFQASSDFPFDEKADGDNIPAMGLNWRPDGTYHTYDLATHQDLQLSEEEAIERLHARLHDGSKWRFHYTYFNLTPQHVSFSVVFGPDGRVTELKPVYGWD
jgi:hypothetical protein